MGRSVGVGGVGLLYLVGHALQHVVATPLLAPPDTSCVCNRGKYFTFPSGWGGVNAPSRGGNEFNIAKWVNVAHFLAKGGMEEKMIFM